MRLYVRPLRVGRELCVSQKRETKENGEQVRPETLAAHLSQLHTDRREPGEKQRNSGAECIDKQANVFVSPPHAIFACVVAESQGHILFICAESERPDSCEMSEPRLST